MKKLVVSYSKMALFIAVLYLGMSHQVFAAADLEADYVEKMKEWIIAAAKIGVLLISVVAFIWVSWIALAKFNEARKTNGEMADVVVIALVAAGLLVFISLLVSNASSVIDAAA
jgi:hypothetical protein